MSRPPPSRYTYASVAKEIAEQLRLRGRGAQKDAALGIGMTEDGFSHRMRGVRYFFNFEELGQLAVYWKAPSGWPFIPWRLGAVFDACPNHPALTGGR